jgi:2-polyprenyl-3-methyl-5-hydroxy-6-metoxy-1,4-benzoquinol methylase
LKQVKCPGCGAEPPAGIVHLEVARCRGCGLGWTLIAQDVDTDEHYQDEVYGVVDNRRSLFEKIILREARAVLNTAERLRPDSDKRLLDFGSGKGQFLLAAKEQGWRGLGVETAIDRANFARDLYQVDVIDSFYEGGAVSEERFDLITLNHVLEHLPEPESILQELVRSNLEPGGLVMIEVPRLNSWQSMIAGSDWVHLDIPKHLTHWTNSRLKASMAKMGFRAVAERRFSIHLGVLGMLQALLVRTGYNGNIILDLKRHRTFGLLLRVGIFLPLAFALELTSALFTRTGITGMYFVADD